MRRHLAVQNSDRHSASPRNPYRYYAPRPKTLPGLRRLYTMGFLYTGLGSIFEHSATPPPSPALHGVRAYPPCMTKSGSRATVPRHGLQISYTDLTPAHRATHYAVAEHRRNDTKKTRTLLRRLIVAH